ncbi:hypothetical protein DFH28DRAFT_1187556 [Melampsora americana]|nr:hypothetical protein DFH28DRAFT_1187556 [Melampsora americana]
MPKIQQAPKSKVQERPVTPAAPTGHQSPGDSHQRQKEDENDQHQELDDSKADETGNGSGGEMEVEAEADGESEHGSDIEIEAEGEEEEMSVEAAMDIEMDVTPGQAVPNPGLQSAIDKLNKYKIPKAERTPSEELTPSQAVQKMKVTSALSRYQRFKAIHEESLKAFKDFQESTKEEDDPIDFDGEIEWMMTALSIQDQALKKREERLNEAITEGQDEIEIIPFRNPMPKVPRPESKAKVGLHTKQSLSKAAKRYLDLEAGSAEFVYDEDDEDDEDSEESDEDGEEEEEIQGPDAIQNQVVDAKNLAAKGKGAGKDTPAKAVELAVEELPISPDSIFHNSDSILDISKLIQNPTADEIEFIRTSATTLSATQFDWGEALKDSVIGVISSWQYHENSQLGQPTHDTLQPLVVLMKRKVNERDTPKNISACPRLLQIAATDPYLTESSIKWPLIHESTRYPWDSRHRIFRAFHSMACRTSKSTVWTSEKDIKNKLKTAHKTIHRIFEESVELISYNAKSEKIEIKTEGEHKVAASMVPMSQSIAWAWQQCMMKAVEEQEKKSSKVHPLGISWLQKRFLLVLTGVMLIYERDVYNRQLKLYCKVKRTATQITARRNELKGSVLHQLSSDYIRKNPVKAISGLKRNQVPSSDALAKVTEKEIQSAANDETFNFRRQAIQALALFLMFGTSGLFHVWVWYKEQRMTDAALLIHMSSILAQRRNQASKSEPHVFYQRSWSRLDHHLFTILREFIDDKGDFKRKIDWPQMTRMFHDRFSPTSLSYLYTLDLCLELHAPLSSRGPDGSVAPDFDSNSKNQGQALIPITEPFRSVWASTEGKATPVTNPQAMYKEADGSRVTKKHPLKAITQAKEKAREEIVDGGGEEESLAEDE